MKKYAIIVDSISTIGSNGNPDLEDVYVLPLGLTSPDGQNFEDTNSKITMQDILESAQKKEYFRTSTTKVGVFFKMLDNLLFLYERIIYLSISSMLSSQYNTFSKLLKADEEVSEKVWIFDTLSAGYAIEEMVLKIKNVINEKQTITEDEIQEIINYENSHSQEYIVCKNLLGVTEGGRLKKTLIKLMDKTATIPIILFDKENHLKSVVRDYDKAYKKITNKVKKKAEELNCKVVKVCLVASTDFTKAKIEQYREWVMKDFDLSSQDIVQRNIMIPVLVHTLFDTMCFYFKFEN